MGKKAVFFCGIDGSGKSTHACMAFKDLKAKGVNCRYEWLRYPRFFSFIPLALSSLLVSTREMHAPADNTTHKGPFHSNKVIIRLWILFQLIDAFLSMLKNVYLPVLVGYTLIIDRCVIDTLIDVAVSLRNEKLIFSVMGRSFLKIIPNNSLVLIFDLKESVAALRKDSNGGVDTLRRKRMHYRSLSKIYCWNIISTDEPLSKVHIKVMKLIH